MCVKDQGMVLGPREGGAIVGVDDRGLWRKALLPPILAISDS